MLGANVHSCDVFSQTEQTQSSGLGSGTWLALILGFFDFQLI